MAFDIHIGDAVEWDWGDGVAEGTVVDRFTSTVTQTLEGAGVKRCATQDQPAYLIEQEDGSEVLASASELRCA